MDRLTTATATLLLALGLCLSSAVEGRGQNIKGRNPLPEQALSETTWIEQFDVSPDGRRIVFKSARGGNYNGWTVAIEGG